MAVRVFLNEVWNSLVRDQRVRRFRVSSITILFSKSACFHYRVVYSEDTENLIGRQAVDSGLESTGCRDNIINQFNIEDASEKPHDRHDVNIDDVPKENVHPIYILAMENVRLSNENELLRKLVKEMDEKNELLKFKIKTLENKQVSPSNCTSAYNQVLTVIAKEKLFSPQLVTDAVGTGNAEITLGHIRSYIMNELQQEIKKSSETAELTKNYRKDTDKLKQHLETLKSGIIVIQGSRCAACHHPLEVPTIHFLCNHSFHQHCFQSFSDDENECPTCQPENKNLLELLKAREYNKDLHETFHSQLEKAHDGFSVAAEYFGRGVFNNYKILRDEILEKTFALPEKTEAAKTKAKSSPKFEREVKTYGPGAEARIRQTEASRSQIRIDSVSEGRMRMQESRYGSSVSSNTSTRFTPKSQEQKISVSKSYEPKKQTSVPINPFEDDEDDYDDEKNPFRDDDDEELDKTNPFGKLMDCDKNLNPFNFN